MEEYTNMKKLWSYETKKDGSLVILKYKGDDTVVTIPEMIGKTAVTAIGNAAFSGCDSLRSVMIPKGIASIGKRVFYQCPNLQIVEFPEGIADIGSFVFGNCQSLRSVILPESITAIDASAFFRCDKLTITAPEGSYAETFAKEKGIPFLCRKDQKVQGEAVADQIAEDNTLCFEENHPIEAFCDASFDKKTIESVIKKAILDPKVLHDVKYADRDEYAPDYVVKCAIGPYIEQMVTRPKRIGEYRTDYLSLTFRESADKVAAALEPDSFREVLRKIAEAGDCRSPQCFIPLCRFGGIDEVNFAISRMNEWKKWNVYSSSGRSSIIVVRGAVLLNETREAMLYAEKCKILGAYAKMRDMDEDFLRDTKLSEFGLDENGIKCFDLGSTVVEASVGQDLSIVLYDTKSQKIVKSLPKRNADPDRYEAAKAELTDLKKNLKKVVKIRNEILFDSFLSGKTQKPSVWFDSYTQNPVLRKVAELIVWQQAKNTFILTAEGLVDHTGAPYTLLVNKKIGVAHPMEMTEDEIVSWQNYFVSNGLKQPFEQIWEPVADLNTVASDRYKDCLIPFYRFKGQEKHGITVTDRNFHNEIYIRFNHCSAEVNRIDWGMHEIDMNHRFEITEFKIDYICRASNHIVAYLDRCTMIGRILKDDISIVQFLPQVTLAQITEFIRMANENNCVNVTAVLLDYQQKNFSDVDPFAEFTLE